MTKKICNEECDFIVRNYDACVAMMDCYEQAKSKVPKWICKQLNNEIKKAMNRIKNISFKPIVYNHECIELYPEDEYCKWETDEDIVGMYFGIWHINWDTLTKDKNLENSIEEYPHIALYMDFPDKLRGNNKKKWEDYKKKMIAKRKSVTNELGKQSYSCTYPADDDDGYIITKNIDNLINLKSIIVDHEDAFSKTADEFIQFVNFVINNQLLQPIPK